MRKTASFNKRFEAANKIMNNDFISCQNIEQSGLISYNSKAIKFYTDSLPSEKSLISNKKQGYFLITGPPHQLSFDDLDKMKPDWLFKAHPCHLSDEIISPGWLIFRFFVPGSEEKTLSEQKKLLSSNECIPRAIEVIWSLMAFKAMSGNFPFRSFMLRTTSKEKDEKREIHICVGVHWIGNPIFTENQWDENNMPSVGLCSILK
jgi:hypothetical protein